MKSGSFVLPNYANLHLGLIPTVFYSKMMTTDISCFSLLTSGNLQQDSMEGIMAIWPRLPCNVTWQSPFMCLKVATDQGTSDRVYPTFSCADNSSILQMRAVMGGVMWAVCEALFISFTSHSIHVDRAIRARAEVAGGNGSLCAAEAEFVTDHSGVLDVPTVIAYGPPYDVAENLHAALVRTGTVYKSDYD